MSIFVWIVTVWTFFILLLPPDRIEMIAVAVNVISLESFSDRSNDPLYLQTSSSSLLITVNVNIYILVLWKEQARCCYCPIHFSKESYV